MILEQPDNMGADSDLIEFFGKECPHCIPVSESLDRLEKEEGIKVTRLEVWHNAENEKIRQEYDKGDCGGVPFLVNKKTGKKLCGSVPYEDILKWAKGE